MHLMMPMPDNWNLALQKMEQAVTGDEPHSPALNAPTRDKRDAALDVAVKALHDIRNESRGFAIEQLHNMRQLAFRALLDIEELRQ
jgi:hypothetical protein